jgi:hypothetical protein
MLADIAVIITALASVGAVAVSLWNLLKIQELHIIVNSRLTELIAVSAHAARANGIAQGRQDVHDEQQAKP